MSLNLFCPICTSCNEFESKPVDMAKCRSCCWQIKPDDWSVLSGSRIEYENLVCPKCNHIETVSGMDLGYSYRGLDCDKCGTESQINHWFESTYGKTDKILFVTYTTETNHINGRDFGIERTWNAVIKSPIGPVSERFIDNIEYYIMLERGDDEFVTLISFETFKENSFLNYNDAAEAMSNGR